MKRPVAILILLLILTLLPVTLVAQPPVAPLNDNPPDVCQQPQNLLPNCNFNNGLDGWHSFTEDGNANFAVLQGGGECHAPLCPAAYIVTESHFVGGFYQQVSVAKGNTYFANVVWLAFDSLSNDKGINIATGGIGRQMGIDPFGGTDSRSPNVVWGPENRRNDCKICDKQEVVATAQADTITVFIRIDDRWKVRAAEQGYGLPPSKDQFWIDDLGLMQVAGDAVPSPPTDTPAPPTLPAIEQADTPVPPTLPAIEQADTPEPELPTDTPEPPTLTPTPVLTATLPLTDTGVITDLQVESPVATPTVAPLVAAAPPTLTPTMVPSPTSTPAERPRATPTTRHVRPTVESETRVLSSGLLGVAGTTVCAGGLVLVIMAVVMAGLAWLYRLGWGKVEDEEDEADEPDDGEAVEIEIVE